MKSALVILVALMAAFVTGCGGDAKASTDDKKNVDRLVQQGMTPESSGQTGSQPGDPVSGKVDPP